MPIAWKKLNHRRGETILETLIAMGVLAIGITIAGQVMATSLRNVNSSKNRVIAVNIAKEGLEAIRNIRDTNWLRYSGKKRECWNHQPTKENDDSCPDLTTGDYKPIQPGNYIIYKQPIYEVDGTYVGWKWRLESLTAGKEEKADLATNGSPPTFYIIKNGKAVSYIWNEKDNVYMDLTQLYTVDIDPSKNSDGDIAPDRNSTVNYTNDPDTYNHALVEEENALGKDYAVKTPFRREIIISYLKDGGTLDGGASDNRMRIQSRVTWQESKNEFSTELATHLTDYQGRVRLE